MEFYHKTVLLKETIDFLNINPDGIYVDATLGAGGLSSKILENLSSRGVLVSLDVDKDAVDFCKKKFINKDRIRIFNSNFIFLDEVLSVLDISKVDGICIDLGVSSYQIDCPERGFSYLHNSRLDMRMSQSGKSAYDVVNFYEENRLSDVIWKYGEERFAKGISRSICKTRKFKKIETTFELVEAIEKVVPKFKAGHSAKRTFQAIRIEVNDELKNLDIVLNKCIKFLKIGGRLLVLTFHSLEDRIVKQRMRFWEKDCLCPVKSPICTCNKIKEAKIINRKVIVPSKDEVINNSRCKSAKLRICEKV